jgi:hypothetical protein
MRIIDTLFFLLMLCIAVVLGTLFIMGLTPEKKPEPNVKKESMYQSCADRATVNKGGVGKC